MLSAVKLYQSVSISGPVATANPRSAKISASSSITWLTGWTVPTGGMSAGSVMSSVSVASRASSSARSSAALRAAMASVAAIRSPLIRGPSCCRCSGAMPPSVFSIAVIAPFLPSSATRAASSESRSAAAVIWLSISSSLIAQPNKQMGANGKPLTPRRCRGHLFYDRATRSLADCRSGYCSVWQTEMQPT